MAFGKEIKRLRENAGITAAAMVQQIGLPSLNRYKSWEQGDYDPKFEDRQIIENFFKISLDKIVKLEEIPAELLLNLTSKVTNSDKIIPLNKGDESIIEEPKAPYHKKRFEEKLKDKEPIITFYDVNASAGTSQSADILPVKKDEGVLHISDLFKGSQYAIRISGNSMMPNYPPGAIIGIREITDKQIIPGSVYVIQKESDLWIKRLFYKDDDQETNMVQCVSDNTMKFESGARVGKPAYPSFNIKIDTINKLFKVTGIYKSNELTVIS